MYLKSIEIQGFKSFAHKTLLNFTNGVTAIVGPNGSGKSNISDAVRWVLGEQKVKQLRGSAMQDVIFAGTEARKPQGFAYVAITFDNSDKALQCDYSEVTVSRRLFRSGESEYMLNGQGVRLKDIQELFFDTGIGREGYSIIGQGQIDAILNGRPDERRGLFDEAAGIVKFKHRKLIAIRKLESEKSSLQRVIDITGELEKRLEPLENQCESAKKYLELSEKLKKAEFNMFVREADQILSESESVKENIKIAEASISEAEEEKDHINKNRAEIDNSVLKLNEDISKKRADISKAAMLKQNLLGQIELKKAGINSDTESIKACTDNINGLGASLNKDAGDLLKYYGGIVELINSIELISKGNETNEISVDGFSGLDEEVKKLKYGIENSLPDIIKKLEDGEAKKALNDIVLGIYDGSETFGTELSEDEKEEDEYAYVLPDWLRSIKNRKDSLEDIKEREEKTSGWLREAKREYDELILKQKKLNDELNYLNRNYLSAKANYESVKNIAERYEGFGGSVRAVMRMRSSISGICGVVADLIKTDKRYEQAIETALGAKIQNIVTKTEDNAKKCIEYLKSSREGRATFLPLSSVKGRKSAEYERAINEKGVIGIGSSLVRCDEEYQSLAEYLLGQVLIVDSMDNAMAIARKYRHGLKIVTLDGELFSPGGAMTGGTYKNQTNLIGRSRQVEELKIALEKAKKLFDIKSEEFSALEEKLSEKKAEADRFAENLNDIESEKKDLSVSILSELKIKLGEVKQKAEFISESINRTVERISDTADNITRLKVRSESLKKNLNEAKELILVLEADIEKTEDEITSLNNEAEALEANAKELSASKQETYSQKEELDKTIFELQKDKLRLENQLEKSEQRLEEITSRIWADYQVSLSKAREFFDEELGNLRKLKADISGIRSEIKALGPVNVNAIEEYKEVSERYSFLMGQQQDLIKSAEAVSGAIKDLDREMKKQFAEQFALINSRFKDVFRELFGGGDAYLELVYDPNSDEKKDELDAGIMISAQPPGKKLQSLLQLSGGEKALTAIALLFAIQSLKPSPFCLLDEIEAALDDSNVERFASYLHKLTDVTQFIIITHRRGTMEAADRLYGVTMQEKGVSKLVSVDLVSSELT